jgi:TRAP-type uncharacterized transport system fused permease subunit
MSIFPAFLYFSSLSVGPLRPIKQGADGLSRDQLRKCAVMADGWHFLPLVALV